MFGLDANGSAFSLIQVLYFCFVHCLKIMRIATSLLISSYFISTFLCQKWWVNFYNSISNKLDLSGHQVWLVPVAINFLIFFIGLWQLVRYATELRKKMRLLIVEHVAGCLIIAGVFLAGYATIAEGIYLRKHIVSSLKESSNDEKAVFEAGYVHDGVFSNNIIGVSIQIPANWHTASLNSIRRLKMSGATQAWGADADKEVPLYEIHPGIFDLLAARKFPDDHPGYNPSIYMQAYDKKIAAKGGIQNLETFTDEFTHRSGPYRPSGAPFEIKAGEHTGWRVHIIAKFAKTTVQQYVYSFETPRYFVTVCASYVDEDDYATLRNAVTTFRVASN